jgi:hypothetical protein
MSLASINDKKKSSGQMLWWIVGAVLVVILLLMRSEVIKVGQNALAYVGIGQSADERASGRKSIADALKKGHNGRTNFSSGPLNDVAIPVAFKGVVVNEAGGAPIAGARVRMLAYPSQESAEKITSDDGTFKLDAPPANRYELNVGADGFNSYRNDAFVITRPNYSMKIMLARALVIKGRVVDQQSQGIPNAIVGLFPEGMDQPLSTRPTDAQGVFSIPFPMSRGGRIQLDAIHAGYDSAGAVTARIPAEEEILLRMKPASRIGALVGLVRDGAQAPVPGAKITISDSSQRTVSEVLTDQRGEYRLIPIRQGNFPVRCTADGFVQVSNNQSAVTISAGRESRLDFILRAGLQMNGVVLNKNGEPVANATVNYRSMNIGRGGNNNRRGNNTSGQGSSNMGGGGTAGPGGNMGNMAGFGSRGGNMGNMPGSGSGGGNMGGMSGFGSRGGNMGGASGFGSRGGNMGGMPGFSGSGGGSSVDAGTSSGPRTVVIGGNGSSGSSGGNTGGTSGFGSRGGMSGTSGFGSRGGNTGGMPGFGSSGGNTGGMPGFGSSGGNMGGMPGFGSSGGNMGGMPGFGSSGGNMGGMSGFSSRGGSTGGGSRGGGMSGGGSRGGGMSGGGSRGGAMPSGGGSMGSQQNIMPINGSTTTDARGRFQINGLTEDSYQVNVQHRDYVELNAQLQPSSQQQTLVLDGALSLRGTANNAQGVPFEQFSLMFESTNSSNMFSKSFSFTTSDGHFDVRGLTPDKYSIMLRVSSRNSGMPGFGSRGGTAADATGSASSGGNTGDAAASGSSADSGVDIVVFGSSGGGMPGFGGSRGGGMGGMPGFSSGSGGGMPGGGGSRGGGMGNMPGGGSRGGSSSDTTASGSRGGGMGNMPPFGQSGTYTGTLDLQSSMQVTLLAGEASDSATDPQTDPTKSGQRSRRGGGRGALTIIRSK